MKKGKILIILIFISMIISNVFSQIEIAKSNVSYCIDTNQFDLQTYTIKNTSTDTFWIWFNKDKDVDISPLLRAYNYFCQVKDKNAISFTNMAIEVSKGSARMHNDLYNFVYYTFIKELKPNQFFTIIVTDALNSTFSEIFIESMSSQDLKEINVDLDKSWFDKFKYKENFIVF